MHAQGKTFASTLIVIVAVTLTAITATAGVIPIGLGAFPASSTLVTFTGLPDGAEVNGLFIADILFSYSLGNGSVVIDGGPGVTNNIEPPNIVSIGDSSGVLTLTLPGFFETFGFGYAILNTVAVSNATTITVFRGATNVGSLSYNGVPDPLFAGGFAGIQSTTAINRVDITFNSTAALAFALDNVRIAAAIPEPSTMLLMLSGAAVLLSRTRRSRSSHH
jgi:hypothetical protein